MLKFYLYKISVAENKQTEKLYAQILKFLITHPKAKITANSEKADIILTIGGDGTFLSGWHATNFSKTIPIFGFNSGRLGYLTEANSNNWKQTLTNIINHKYTIENRLILNAKSYECQNFDDSAFSAINDIVIRSKGCSDFIISINDEQIIQYRGDGVIVATPMGSTAYALSAGGGLIDPKSSIIEIQALAPHTLANRPIIFDISNIQSIKIKTDSRNECLVLADGEPIGTKEVEIQPSSEKMQVIKFDNQKFQKTVKNVFGSI